MMADQNGLSEMSGRKESNCVRCRNHGLKIVLRGHKQYCPYAACACDKCRFTAEQQRQMRLQNAIRRSEASDRSGTPGRRQRNSSNSAPTMVSPQHHQQQQQPPQQVQQQQQQMVIQQQAPPPPQQQPQQHQIIVTTVASLPQEQHKNGGSPHEEDKKMFFDCSSELLKKFRYPWEMMPIMYALAKFANGNIDEIMQRIEEGQHAVNEQLRLQTLNMYFGAAQNSTAVPATRECG